LLYWPVTELAPIPRSQICVLFWPDLPDAIARRNLTHLLTLLRQALPQPAVLLAETETIALDPQLVWSDTTAATRLLRTVAAQARVDALAEALELYRGLFLAGFALPGCPEYEAWLDQEHHAWERRIDETLAAMVEVHTAVHDYPAATAVAQRMVDRDVPAEDAHRRLIELYAAIGDRTDGDAVLRRHHVRAACVIA
jgi:DNA-binding SARP family transcriptional activator